MNILNLKKIDISSISELSPVFNKFKPDYVIHLAAQAGVRYSFANPASYVSSNIVGTFNLLECIRVSSINHFLFASTSSVYGSNKNQPYNENHRSDYQLSFYASSKKSCESIIHSYSHLYKIPSTCFRFFTVYGPFGRPDMAYFKFTKSILEEKSYSYS